MKRFTILMVLSSMVAIPLMLRKIRQQLPLHSKETLRYDLEDLLTDEAL